MAEPRSLDPRQAVSTCRPPGRKIKPQPVGTPQGRGWADRVVARDPEQSACTSGGILRCQVQRGALELAVGPRS